MDLKAYSILLGAVAAAVFVTGAVLAQYSDDFPRQVGDLIPIVLSTSIVLFGIALVLGAVALVQAMGRGTGHVRDADDADVDALEIVRRRYARGEIDQEEFRTLRDDLLSENRYDPEHLPR